MSIRPQSAPLNPLSFIDRLISDIELSPTQHAQAKQSYEAVTDVLQKIGSPIQGFSPRNRAQGSMRIGTTIRPPAQDEFDLDVLCWLDASGHRYTPHQIYELVWDTLGNHATYREMRVRRSRCIRLPYARQFHLDITPAIPDWIRGTPSLYIPDREQKIWCSTHPISFADDWFKPISLRLPRIVELIANTANIKAAFSASVEPLPEYGAFEKTPLQRIVQLVKHDRDRHFADDAKHRPSSILLTTLTAQAYEREVSRTAPTLLEFVVRVVEGIPAGISKFNQNGNWTFMVSNPVNRQENFAESWTNEHYRRFCAWHEKAVAWLRSTTSLEGRGADVLLNRMSEEFGKERVVKAARALGSDVKNLHESGQSRVSPLGRIGAVGAFAAPTVFFGD